MATKRAKQSKARQDTAAVKAARTAQEAILASLAAVRTSAAA